MAAILHTQEVTDSSSVASAACANPTTLCISSIGYSITLDSRLASHGDCPAGVAPNRCSINVILGTPTLDVSYGGS